MSETDNSLFGKVKNNYLLGILFDFLNLKKKLNIIRYNKNLQKRLGKDINDYIKEDWKIIIEITPKENEYGKFINISTGKYYHIFFNDNLEEMKRDYITVEDYVNKIKIVIDYEIKNLFGLFYKITFIRKINFIKFRRNDIKNIYFFLKNVLH